MALGPGAGYPAVCKVPKCCRSTLKHMHCHCLHCCWCAYVSHACHEFQALHWRASVWQAIVPSATLALYHAMAYLAGKLGHTRAWQRTGGRLHAWLLARQVCALHPKP